MMTNYSNIVPLADQIACADLPIIVPLTLDPLSALMAEEAGFKAMYLGGGTLGYQKTCTEANLSLTQMINAGVEIRAATSLPLLLDAQCGWGDAMHVKHATRMAEAAGFAGMEIEDQLMPKRAHHHVGVEHLIPIDEMVAKVKTAIATRCNRKFLIIARTNACRSAGLSEALRRAEAYKQAGADLILVLTKDPKELRTVGERIEGPHMTFGSVGAEILSLGEFGNLGYKLFVDATTPFIDTVNALRLCYKRMASGKNQDACLNKLKEEIENVHNLIQLNSLLDIESRTVEPK